MNIEIKTIREKLAPYKIQALVGAFIVLCCSGLWLIFFSHSYGVLFSQMTPMDYESTINLLQAQGEPFEADASDYTIKVKKERIDAIRIALMSNQERLSPNVGFELFEKSDFGLTEFSQKVNYQRALQGELERTIQSIEEVAHARVQLNIPQKQLFHHEKEKASAAVTLHLKHPLKLSQVKSIQALISASVNQLAARDVVIIDQFGNNLLKEQDQAPLQLKKKIEHYLAEKVHDILKPIYPHDLIVVKVDVDLNFDEVQKDNEHPHQVAVMTHEKRSEQAPLDSKKSKEKHITVEKAYQFGIEKEHFKRARGHIERLNVSVVVPRSTSKESLDEMKDLIGRVVGLHPERGDKMSIAALGAIEDKSHQLPLSPHNTQTSPFSPVALGFVSCLALIGLYCYYRERKRQALLRDLQNWLRIEEGQA